jgi:hypothetical protein
METKPKETLSRRQFLKIAGPWAGTLAVGAIGLKIIATSRKGESPLFAPEDYRFEDASSESFLWPTLKDELKAVFVHELTHIKTAQDKELIQTYADLLEWEKTNSKWVYRGEESIVNDLLARRKHELHEGPEEDLAISAMIFATSPHLLENSENDSDRRRFEFVKRELFS